MHYNYTGTVPQACKRTQQKIRNILKNIETLSYNITDLQKLDVLKTRWEDFELLAKESVPLDTNGLVLRPSCTIHWLLS